MDLLKKIKRKITAKKPALIEKTPANVRAEARAEARATKAEARAEKAKAAAAATAADKAAKEKARAEDRAATAAAKAAKEKAKAEDRAATAAAKAIVTKSQAIEKVYKKKRREEKIRLYREKREKELAEKRIKDGNTSDNRIYLDKTTIDLEIGDLLFDRAFDGGGIRQRRVRSLTSRKSVKKGGRKKVRKHRGIIQSGGNAGKLRKGYKYSKKKLKNGKREIIKVNH